MVTLALTLLLAGSQRANKQLKWHQTMKENETGYVYTCVSVWDSFRKDVREGHSEWVIFQWTQEWEKRSWPWENVWEHLSREGCQHIQGYWDLPPIFSPFFYVSSNNNRTPPRSQELAGTHQKNRTEFLPWKDSHTRAGERREAMH